MLNIKNGFKSIRNRIARHLTNRAGWKTQRKIVVIESDDWGSVRMPSIAAFEQMKKKGIPVEKSVYCRYDSLASEDDLVRLFDVLSSYKDINGNHPVLTANCVVSNPDFEKIKNSGMSEYFCESICETFKRYPRHQNCIELWKEGDRDRIFHPQFHGKAHLNSSLWLKLLQNESSDYRIAFENHCWGLSRDIYPENWRSVQAAFDAEDPNELEQHAVSIREGLAIFEDLFGFRAKSFIASNYIWSSELNKVLADEGVAYLQGMKYQKLPIYDHGRRKMIRHFIGEKNGLGQYYLVRNCSFEPSWEIKSKKGVKDCIKEIETAFFWKRPATICSHRVNYVGYLDADNRNRNLEQLNRLISEIIKKWPEVEFMTSDQLGQLIEHDNG